MVTETEGAVLTHLLKYGNDVPSSIGESIDANPKYVSQIYDSLQEGGYVERRQGVWSLTPVGVSMAQSINREQDRDSPVANGE
jgi:DNA-binding MarR family transcriptional regulator